MQILVPRIRHEDGRNTIRGHLGDRVGTCSGKCKICRTPWGAADLALSRAGANSVAEVAANGVPAIFVPYPWHKDLHQRFNALDLVETGAASLAEDAIDPTANLESLGPPLMRLLSDAASRDRMRTTLAHSGKRDGASEIAALIHARVLGGDRRGS